MSGDLLTCGAADVSVVLTALPESFVVYFEDSEYGVEAETSVSTGLGVGVVSIQPLPLQPGSPVDGDAVLVGGQLLPEQLASRFVAVFCDDVLWSGGRVACGVPLPSGDEVDGGQLLPMHLVSGCVVFVCGEPLPSADKVDGGQLLPVQETPGFAVVWPEGKPGSG